MELINIKSRKSRSQNESQALLDADPDFSGNSDNSVDSTVGIGEGLTNRQRNGQTQKSGKKNNWTLVERTVEPGDTVQKLSLLYGIKVSDLKKANGLVSDQDFFALKTVKIPVKKYSFAGDLLETSTSSVPLQPPMKPTFPQDSIPLIPLNQANAMSDWDYMEDSEDVFTGTSECNNVSEPKSCKDILKNVDKDLAKVKHYHNSLEESHEIIEDSDMRHMPHMLARRANTMYVSVRNFLLLIALPGSFLVIVLFLAIYFTRRDAKSGQ